MDYNEMWETILKDSAALEFIKGKVSETEGVKALEEENKTLKEEKALSDTKISELTESVETLTKTKEDLEGKVNKFEVVEKMEGRKEVISKKLEELQVDGEKVSEALKEHWMEIEDEEKLGKILEAYSETIKQVSNSMDLPSTKQTKKPETDDSAKKNIFEDDEAFNEFMNK